MKFRQSIAFLLVSVNACLAAWSAPLAAQEGFTLLYTHDIHAELEPCGCSKTPVGGFARRATVIRQIREEAGEKPVLLVDAGNYFFTQAEKREYSDDFIAIRSSHMLNLFSVLDYDVLGIGGMDLLQGAGMLAYLAGRCKAPVFSSNLRLESNLEHTHVGSDGATISHNDGTGRHDPIITLRKKNLEFHIISLTDIHPRRTLASGFILDPPMEQWDRLKGEIQGRNGFVIVLTSLPDTQSIQIANELGNKGVVIRRTEAQPATEVPPNLLGTLTMKGQALGRADIQLDERGHWVEIAPTKIVLDDQVKPDAMIAKMRQDYNAHLKDVEAIPRGEAPPYVRRFAGVQKCGECHKPQMDWWLATPHAHAMATLEKDQNQYNPDCISCHVTGYGEYYGFKKQGLQPDLANVQCESCHGIESSMMHGVFTKSEWEAEQAPPEGYSEAQWKVLGPRLKQREKLDNRRALHSSLEQTCITCHTPEHSESFEFKSYLARMQCPLGLPEIKIIPDPPAEKPAKP